jgi:hypothetical protein
MQAGHKVLIWKGDGMDDRFTPGRIVTSKAGHDRGSTYMVVATDQDYVYVADGRLKRVGSPKRKKSIHLQYTGYRDAMLGDRLEAGDVVRDEEIKRSIKMYTLTGGN